MTVRLTPNPAMTGAPANDPAGALQGDLPRLLSELRRILDALEIQGSPAEATKQVAQQGPFDKTARPVAGTLHVNPATGQLVAAGQPASSSSEAPRESPMGNVYTPIGRAAVEEAKKDPHVALAMEGYEENIAKLSSTYDAALYELSAKVKDIGQEYRGANINGETERGKEGVQRIHDLLATFDPVAGTFKGFDPEAAARRFQQQAEQSGLTLEGERARRARAGLDDQGNLLPGFAEVKVAPNPFANMTQDEARRKVFLDHHPFATEAQYQAAIHDPSRNQGPRYRGAEINAIASPNWGLGLVKAG